MIATAMNFPNKFNISNLGISLKMSIFADVKGYKRMEEEARKIVRNYVKKETGEKEFLVYRIHGWDTMHHKNWTYESSVHDEEILYKVTYDKCSCKYTLDVYERSKSITL